MDSPPRPEDSQERDPDVERQARQGRTDEPSAGVPLGTSRIAEEGEQRIAEFIRRRRVYPQPPDAEVRAKRVTLALYSESLRLRPSSTFRVALTLSVDAGWHINSNTPLQSYLIPTTLTLADNSSVTLEKVSWPAAAKVTFDFSDEPLSVYEGAVTIVATLAVSPASPSGETTLTFEVALQPCNDSSCLAPASASLPLAVTIDPSAPLDAHPRHPSLFPSPDSTPPGT